MSTELTFFLLGFLSAFALSTALVLAYYCRARRRVRSIQQAILNYQKASAVVGEAVNQTFAKQ